ncbi:MAG TPA: retropepsin-like aspartic protease [Pyrinomonadaceae bacterium]|nr:retropepsin-like aspartic protease [Pyrinomonadaceae bacterium]
MRARRLLTLSAVAAIVWAVSTTETAHSFAQPLADSGPIVTVLPQPARFRLEKDTGLLIRVWLDGKGPYIFAIDTGAGLNVITERAASTAGLQVRRVTPTIVGGLSAARVTSNREAVIGLMALGDQANNLPSQKSALIVSALAPGIDGILDPTDTYSPFGYSIDISNELIEAMNPATDRSTRQSTDEGAVVPWLRVAGSSRPFVRLGDGRLALLDTGSGFGLAVSERNAVIIGRPNGPNGRVNRESVRDIGGGTIFSRRVSPTTISIGELVLRGIPTDVLSQVDTDAPVILGRDALYPFKITFDPRRRLIEFVTSK